MTTNGDSDTALVAAARGGDRGALDELLRRHERRIYRFGLRMCGDPDQAQEVLQRTLLAAFEQVGAFRGESRFSTWLYALARSACGRLHRRTRSAPIHDVALDVPDQPTLEAEMPPPDEQAGSNQLAELVNEAVSLLPDASREAVVLRDIEELSIEEAAAIAKVHPNAFKSRLHRARQELRLTLAVLLREQGGSGPAGACPQLATELAGLADRPVSLALCGAIEEHLARCANCAERLGALKGAAALCRRLPGDTVPPAVQRAVRSALVEALGREAESAS